MKRINLLKYIKVLVFLTLANLAVLFIRNWIVGDTIFNFLKSNLLSGIAPFVVAALMYKFYNKLNTFFFWLCACIWLLFYPNSPYMISDLIHVNMDTKIITSYDLVVYDTLIIFSLAMLSVFYGFISLKIMFNLFEHKYNKYFAHSAIFISLLLSCLGFYMGREMLSTIHLGNGYLYSWEIFLEPMDILKQVWNSLFPISQHLPAYAMMLLFGFVQYCLLIIMKDVGDFESSDTIK